MQLTCKSLGAAVRVFCQGMARSCGCVVSTWMAKALLASNGQRAVVKLCLMRRRGSFLAEIQLL